MLKATATLLATVGSFSWSFLDYNKRTFEIVKALFIDPKIKAFKMLLFGILNPNLSNINAIFWHFKFQNCFMKLHKS